MKTIISQMKIYRMGSLYRKRLDIVKEKINELEITIMKH